MVHYLFLRNLWPLSDATWAARWPLFSFSMVQDTSVVSVATIWEKMNHQIICLLCLSYYLFVCFSSNLNDNSYFWTHLLEFWLPHLSRFTTGHKIFSTPSNGSAYHPLDWSVVSPFIYYSMMDEVWVVSLILTPISQQQVAKDCFNPSRTFDRKRKVWLKFWPTLYKCSQLIGLPIILNSLEANLIHLIGL